MKGQAKNLQNHKSQILKILSIVGVLEVPQLGRMIDIKAENMDAVLIQIQRAGQIVRRGSKIATDESAIAEYTPLQSEGDVGVC